MDLDQIIAQLGLGPADVEVAPQFSFKMFSGILRAYEDNGQMRLAGIASSTTRDLHGDTMLESALEDMELSANGNLTIFLNHEYKVPEDVAGSVEKAKMSRRGVDGEGSPNYDLDFDVLVNKSNPRAVEAWQAIKAGTKLGLSIGALIPEGGAVRNKKDGTLTIAHVHLLETSIVGIPANPRSWISQAVKAFNTTKAAATTHQLGAPTVTLDLDRDSYNITGSLQGLRLGGDDAVSTVADTQPSATAASKCPDCGGSADSPKNGCKNPMHNKAIEPDVQDSRIRIIEVDTDDEPAGSSSGGDSSQGAGSSEPDDEEDYAAPAPDVAAAATQALSDADRVAIASLEPVLRDSVQGLLVILEATTRELAATKAARDEAIVKQHAAEELAGQAVKMAHDVVEKVANTPLARKATVLAAKSDLGHLEGLYGPEFLRILQQEK